VWWLVLVKLSVCSEVHMMVYLMPTLLHRFLLHLNPEWSIFCCWLIQVVLDVWLVTFVIIINNH